MKKLSRLLLAGTLSLFLGTSVGGALSAFEGGYGRFDGEGGGLYGPYSSGHGGGDDCCFNGGGYESAPCGFNSCCDAPRNNDGCSRFAFGVDYLFWDVTQTGLDVAQTTVGNPPSSSTCCDCDATCRSETEFFKFKGKSGYRLGLSYQLPCWDDVSLNFVYTYFHPKVSKRFYREEPGLNQVSIIQMTTDVIDVGNSPVVGCSPALLPVNDFVFNGPDSNVHTRVKLKYELFDLVLSKNMGCDAWTWTPYIGARVLWIRESLRNEIDGSFVVGSSTTNASYAFAWKQQVPAAGLTLGIHGRYTFCGALNVIGHFGASVLGGKSKYHNNYYPFNTLDCPALQKRAHRAQIITGWDGSLGLGYDWNFCSCPVRLGVGYEIQDWFNIPERVRYFNRNSPNTATNPITTAQTSDAGGRLTVHGLFVRVAFAF